MGFVSFISSARYKCIYKRPRDCVRMGNICSSRSSIATQTGSARKKKSGFLPKNEKEASTVQRRTWDDVFDHVLRTDFWEGKPRASRAEWKPYLEKIEELSNLQRKTLEETKLKSILQGREVEDSLSYNNKIILYVCSSGTDTEVERTVFMKDVFPFARDVCRLLDLELEVIDLRLGRSTNIKQDEYQDVEVRPHELKRFRKANEASIFLCFVSDYYGERILPLEIEEETLDTITAYMINNNIDTDLIKQSYILDKNSIRRKYVLRTSSDDRPQACETDRNQLLKLMKETIPECFPYGKKMISKYFASMYEYELITGLQSTGRKIFIKKIVNSTETGGAPLDGNMVLNNKTNDEYDFKQLEELNEMVKESVRNSKDSIFQLNYNDMHEIPACENITKMTDYVCEKLLDFIAKHYINSVSLIKDYVLQDILVHSGHSKTILQDHHHRENEIEKVRKYLQDDTTKVPLVIHGVQGIGKSAFMVTAAYSTRLPHYVQVLRHIGLTPESTHVKDLLTSICSQLERAYNKNVTNITGSYGDLITRFRNCLSFATKTDPIILYLISLNNLSDENFSQNLRWLQLEKECPSYVKIIMSTSPGQSLDSLRRLLPVEKFIEIVPILPLEVPGIIQMKLAEVGRQITFDQTQTLVSLYQRSSFSLFYSVGLNIAIKWHSYDTANSEKNPTDILEITQSQLTELEDKYGPVVVHHTLAYITASKNGLSSNELIDLLSCDDEVLDKVISNYSSHVRRFSSVHLISLLQELSHYLVERSYRGVNVFIWTNREIADMMKGRYLVNHFRDDKVTFEKNARAAIADYFDNKWLNGKVYSNLNRSTAGEKFGRLESRYLMNQKLVPCESSNPRKLNSRRLTELPYQIIHLEEWNRFQAIYKLEFIEAKFEDGLGFECFRDLSIAASLSGKKDIRSLTRLVASNLSILWKEPFAVYQISSQWHTASTINKLLHARSDSKFPMQFVRNVSVLKEDTNCEMTLLGHTAGVRYSDLSPAGDMIVSTADDGSMNIWYVISGMELAAMTSLPLPIETDNNDHLPSIPCCFSGSGDRIVVATEDGSVFLMDNSGTLIKQETTDIDNITCVKFSLDGKTLVTSFRGGQLYFWDSETLEHQSTIQLEELVSGLDLSPDGTILAVACSKGLVLVDMTNLVILSTSTDTLTLGNLDQEVLDWFAVCCSFHPSGKEVLVGSSDNSISQWNVSEGTIKTKIVGHFGWVTCIKLNKDGDRMYSGSADRTIRAWSFDTKWTCIATLVGHSDVVTMVALDPTNGEYLVSSSLDCSLKIWNVQTIKSEEEVIEKDDGFEEGSDVMDQDGDDDATEFVPFNTLSISHTTGTLVYSKGSDRYCRIKRPGYPTVNTKVLQGVIGQTSFTFDGSKVVILDSGRKKSDIHKITTTSKSNVYICSVDTGNIDHVIDGAEFADDEWPTSISCGAWFIAVGTNKGDIYIYDDKGFEMLQQISWHDVVTTMASCRVKNHLLAVSHKQAIILKISLDSYETVAYLPETEFDYTHCTFSPVGNTLVSGLENGEFHVWRISDSDITLVARKTEHTSRIKDIAFTRSGYTMVTCGDRSMRVWDMRNGVELKCVYYNTIERIVCVEEDVVLAGDFSGKLNTLTW